MTIHSVQNDVAVFLKEQLPDVDESKLNAVAAMLPQAGNSARGLLEEELVMGASRRERRAWLVSFVMSLCAAGGIAAAVMGISQSETHAFLTIVDKDTGIAERAVTVEQAVIEQSDAVLQSLVHGYVTDRETFDGNDNEVRVLDVFRRSSGTARRSLQMLWDENHTEFSQALHPPFLYGSGSKVSVQILNITRLSDHVTQVRFTKTLEKSSGEVLEGKFVAVVTHVFDPETRKNLELVWQNPFGFQVTGYRVTAEVEINE